MSNEPLTKREIIFCQSYLANDFNGLKALQTAGYSDTNSTTSIRRILERPKIKAYLDELQATAAAAATLSKAWVIGEAMNLYKEAMAAKAFAPAAKVLGMLGSEVGALQENKQINQTVTVEHMLGNIPKGIEAPLKQIN
jgi:phage terminase small subunit